MTQDEITKEQFALWSFQRDRKAGGYRKSMDWDRLPEEEKKLYLEEAEYYITKHPRDDWPNDIMERLEKST